jgi:site-specific DNA recombinase
MGLIAMQQNPPRVAIYARISPTPEGKAGESFSIASQIHEMKQKALKEFGSAKPDEFIDNKVSGGDLNRPEMDRLRDCIALKKYDVVIAYDPGRWTREPSDKIILKRELEKGGARLVYVTVQYEDTAEGGLSEDVQDAVSKYEKGSSRNAPAVAAGRSRAMGTRTPVSHPTAMNTGAISSASKAST